MITYSGSGIVRYLGQEAGQRRDHDSHESARHGHACAAPPALAESVVFDTVAGDRVLAGAFARFARRARHPECADVVQPADRRGCNWRHAGRLPVWLCHSAIATCRHAVCDHFLLNDRNAPDERRQSGRHRAIPRQQRVITSGMFKGARLLLLTTMGARSGKTRVNPLASTRDGERYAAYQQKTQAANLGRRARKGLRTAIRADAAGARDAQ